MGSHFLQEIYDLCETVTPKCNPNWNLSWPCGPDELLMFTLGSTRLPKRCPMAPKVVPRVPRGNQNGANMLPKFAQHDIKMEETCTPNGTNINQTPRQQGEPAKQTKRRRAAYSQQTNSQQTATEATQTLQECPKTQEHRRPRTQEPQDPRNPAVQGPSPRTSENQGPRTPRTTVDQHT